MQQQARQGGREVSNRLMQNLGSMAERRPLRACGFGRHETTLFGDAILAAMAAMAGKGGE